MTRPLATDGHALTGPLAFTPSAAGGPTRMMKFVTNFHPGGTERQFTNLALGLDAARYDLRFGCLHAKGPLMDPIRARGIAVDEYRIPKLFHRDTASAQMRLARDLRRTRVRIVHSYNFYANVFAIPAARLARVDAVIASIRDMGIYLTPRQLQVQRLACRLADVVLVNAEAIRRWLIADGYPAERIRVIGNGIDLAPFEAPHTPGTLHHEIGLPADTPLVFVVSRLVPRKGLEQFLEAAAIDAPRHPGAHWVMAGVAEQPDYAVELERLAARLGLGRRIHFLGPRNDVPALLADAAVAVLPSLSEGLSNVLLESMASGAPTVATRVGGAPEVVEDGVNGLLVPPGDAAALARAVGRLLDDRALAVRVGAAARTLVRARFSLAAMVAQTTAVYDALLQGRRLEAPAH
jgi:glycosyltransferase involved in cell wall biosynthesis